MRIFSILLFITGILVTGWVTGVAYNNAVKLVQFNDLPLFLSQNCKLKYVENSVMSEDDKRKNLSIYYSGVAGMQEKDVIEMHEKSNAANNNEADIQKKIKEIVEEKKNANLKNVEEKKVQEKIDIKTSKDNKNPPISITKKKSIFDVID